MMTTRSKLRRSRRGAVIVFVAIALPFILLIAAMAVDMAYLKLARRELENTADSTARAAMSEFMRTGDTAASRAAAQHVASLNYVANEPMNMAASDIEFGIAQPIDGGFEFVPSEDSPNAVRVQARRTADSAAGPIKLFFARSFGKVNIELVQSATAQVNSQDIAIVLDRGRTMAFDDKESSKNKAPSANGKPWNWCKPLKKDARFVDIMNAIDAKLTEFEAAGSTVNVALVTYGNTATLDQDFTTDYNLIRAKLNQIANAYCEDTLENMADGIRTAAQAAAAHKALTGNQVYTLLISDDGALFGDPVIEAGKSKQNGVPVEVVSYTAEVYATPQVSANPSLQKLVQVLFDIIAAVAGGQHKHAHDDTQIAAAVDEMMSKGDLNLVSSSQGTGS